jgi:hypothetical protein
MLDYQTHFSYSQSDQRDNWDNKNEQIEEWKTKIKNIANERRTEIKLSIFV